MMLANKINNDPILKIVIFPSCNCGDFTLLELWKCFTAEVEYITMSSPRFFSPYADRVASGTLGVTLTSDRKR
ncbi:hypothetical protein SAMN05216403_1483 [Nitrosospira multiformis ATCC 25196]|uniref:Uncharacterized protein n=1 Tax=Nitrosospira multiformis (strain ATCC 25196 / NCIMB 11849 / C 71) TaxID=323848 RepID=A0A1H5Y6F5_NITMU|nr:hypothetical protein SAMN05216403_1483 [Nitrosospira multiformis ATCC 25196]